MRNGRWCVRGLSAALLVGCAIASYGEAEFLIVTPDEYRELLDKRVYLGSEIQSDFLSRGFEKYSAAGRSWWVSPSAFERDELKKTNIVLDACSRELTDRPFFSFRSLSAQQAEPLRRLLEGANSGAIRDIDSGNVLVSPSVVFHCEVDGHEFEFKVDLVNLTRGMLRESSVPHDPSFEEGKKPFSKSRTMGGYVVLELLDDKRRGLDHDLVSKAVAQLEEERAALLQEKNRLMGRLFNQAGALFDSNPLADIGAKDGMAFRDLPEPVQAFMQNLGSKGYARLGAREAGFWDRLKIRGFDQGLSVGTSFEMPSTSPDGRIFAYGSTFIRW